MVTVTGLLTALRVFRPSDNESELVIQPAVEENTSGVFYQLSSSSTPILWTSPITVTASESIIFFHCQYNNTFTIGRSIILFSAMTKYFEVHVHQKLLQTHVYCKMILWIEITLYIQVGHGLFQEDAVHQKFLFPVMIQVGVKTLVVRKYIQPVSLNSKDPQNLVV